MFGWEFPPYNTGGLGVACYGLTKGLSKLNVEVTFVLPRLSENAHSSFVNLISADVSKIKYKAIDSALQAYISSREYKEHLFELTKKRKGPIIYGRDLFQEVYRYTKKAAYLAKNEYFDVIHCHDWMTYGAGIEAKKVSGKPLVVHIHATEFDRTGGQGVNQVVYDLEREGFQAADKIVAVSNFTKNKVVQHYGINPDKVEVVHNAIDLAEIGETEKQDLGGKKVVLFLGRITIQKGPDYFVYAAKKVLDHYDNVIFVVAGTGDMERFMIEKAAELGIADKMVFAGFLRGGEIERAYRMADLYVMPSVSEPFGLTPLESIRSGTPVIISKQSGVSEILKHALKVDFWDIDEMANKIIAVLKYEPLHESLKENAYLELKKFDWTKAAAKVIDVYHRLGVN